MSPAILHRAKAYAGLVKLSHSVFAMPFALLSLLVASAGRPSLRLLLLVITAVVAARTAAMAFNRFADRELDAANPRTRNREVPSGLVSPRSALTLAAGAGAGFLLVCWFLSPTCLLLGVPTLAFLLGYSYAKRFTWLCHLWLGVALGVSPIAAWFAVDGEFGPRLYAPLVLGCSVAFLWLDDRPAPHLPRWRGVGCRVVDLAASLVAAERFVAHPGRLLHRQWHVGGGDVRGWLRRPVLVAAWQLPTPASN